MTMEAGREAVPVGLAEMAQREPEKPALIGPERMVTYGELNERACRLANAVAGWGIGPEDKVAALLHNGVEFLEIRYALAKLRAIVVPVNYRLKGPEIDYILGDSDAADFFVGADL